MKLIAGLEGLNWNTLESEVAISFSSKSFYKNGFFANKRIDEVKSINLALFDRRLKLLNNFYGGIRLILEKSDSSVNLYDFDNLTKNRSKKRF